MSGFRRFRDHSNERPMPPEPNVVRLIPSHPEPDMPVPELDDAILHDQETVAIAEFGPLKAYRLAAHGYGPEFAAGWSTFVRSQVRWHRTLEALRWAYENTET